MFHMYRKAALEVEKARAAAVALKPAPKDSVKEALRTNESIGMLK